MKSQKVKIKSTVLFVEKNKKGLTVKYNKKTSPGFAIYPTKLQNNLSMKKAFSAIRNAAVSELVIMKETVVNLNKCRYAPEDIEFTEKELISVVDQPHTSGNADKFY